MGHSVRDRARANIEHRTGRHGDPSLPPLANTLRISASQRGVSIHSAQPYAAVQDQGGRVGKGAIIPRARASGYMTDAVRESRPAIEQALVDIGSKIERTYGGV